MTATAGSWVGTSSIAYTYQWRRWDSSGGGCTSVAGATGASYSLSTADVGSTIRVAVTARNDAGASSAESAPTASVSPPQTAPAPTAQPSFPIHAGFYYPWYPETWTVNGAHVFYRPTLGYSSTTDVATQTAHIRSMEYAGMNAAISSWWGLVITRTLASGSSCRRPSRSALP